eukprot:scaffold5119_cov153-Skeletonema_dohrnii-CCMP3373.AAC.2
MEILADKIDEGFAFPLNPKWILCDEGWKDLYDKLLASDRPNVQDALNVWYPADVRERIAAISSKHPIGYGPSDGATLRSAEGLALMRKKRLTVAKSQHEYEEISAEIAELELERYKNATTGVWKLRRALLNAKNSEEKKKTKKKKHSFYSIVLMILQSGKEADAQNENGGGKKPGSKKLRDRLRRRSSVDSSDHASSITSAPSERSEASSQTDGKDMHDRRPSRRRSFTRYIRKRLSITKKMHRSASM